jgi:DNA invertase Pin-like site-specific DNA recombinase
LDRRRRRRALEDAIGIHRRLSEQIWKIDTVRHQAAGKLARVRLGRSLQDLVAFLAELHALGIDLFLHQQGLDTTTPAGKAMFQMMGVFAEFERAMIQERVRAGLRGKQLGRPKIASDVEAAIRAALRKKDRPGVRVIAAEHGVAINTVMRIAHAQ